MLDVKCQLMRQYAPGLFYPSLIYYHHRLQLRRQSLSLSLLLEFTGNTSDKLCRQGPGPAGTVFQGQNLGILISSLSCWSCQPLSHNYPKPRSPQCPCSVTEDLHKLIIKWLNTRLAKNPISVDRVSLDLINGITGNFTTRRSQMCQN